MIWRIRGADARPERLRALYFFALVGALFGWAVTRKWFAAPLGFGLVLLSTMEFWWGETFTLDEDGAARRVGLATTRIAWGDVRRVEWLGDVLLLSPLPPGSRLDPFRGVRLSVPRAMRAEVEARVLAARDVRRAL